MSRQYFFTGTAAPTTTPTYAGSIFVDTTNGRIYFATGTSSSSDWDLMPVNLSEITIDTDLALGGVYKIKKALGLDFQPSTELTISTGAITQTQSLHSVDTESDAASDDLDTITIASDMNILGLKLENAARVVTLKHGTGNLSLPGGSDVVMIADVIYMLIYDGSNWILTQNSTIVGDVVGPASATDNGLVTFDSTTGKLIQDNTGVTVDDSGNFAGVGNINNNGSGGNNNCIGDNAGAALTTGANNTLIGSGAGDLITTGSQNTVLGDLALDANVSSSANTAIGYSSLGSSTTGANNTAVGFTSLSELTTGSNNVSLGISAGRYISGGVTANQTSGTSCYIGRDTKAGADGNSNETVIGYNTTGNGSNTVTLGNTSVTDVFVGSDNLQTLVAQGTDNDQTGTTYTLVLADQENTTVWMNNASANTLTIPLNATVAFAVGTKISVMMEGAGVTTIDIATGGTINGTLNGSVVINNQYQGATLVKRATDTWIILGDVT